MRASTGWSEPLNKPDGQHGVDPGDAAISVFDLDPEHSEPSGIVYADGLLYVGEGDRGTVSVYRPNGEPVADSDFDLDPGNSTPTGITYGDGLFYVVDGFDNKVYVYRPGGERLSALSPTAREQDLGAKRRTRSRPCYVSDCRSGELPEAGKLCCREHRRSESLAEFCTRLDNMAIALALADTELEPAERPN